MIINDAVITAWQKTVFTLCDLYANEGYAPYRMGKFEEYDLYAGNREFLISDSVLTFTDPNGRLMALKPDVTLSVIKNSRDEPNETKRLFYSENVYRGKDSFREILQAGLECFGKVGPQEVAEVIRLAVKSLMLIGDNCALQLSCPDIIEEMIEEMGLSSGEIKALYKAVGEKNLHSVREICCEGCEKLTALLGIHGKAADMRPVLRQRLSGMRGYAEFDEVLEALSVMPEFDKIHIDFSLTGDANYYNGIIFKGFVAGIPDSVLSGGRYDRLMRRMKRVSGAVGFAVYTENPERMNTAARDDEGWLNVALPKGRLGERVYAMFARAGFECPSILEPNRKLIFENAEKRVRYFWVKPADVAIYVERGAADIGVVGKDVLLETSPDVYEMLDLKTGICRMAVAAPKGYKENTELPLKIATKFSEIAKRYYLSKGRDIDIIHLNGSIEIAPLLGLSDVIVDIVETGTTLRENNLEVIETVLPISARLIANKAAFRFKPEPIERLKNSLESIVEENV